MSYFDPAFLESQQFERSSFLTEGPMLNFTFDFMAPAQIEPTLLHPEYPLQWFQPQNYQPQSEYRQQEDMEKLPSRFQNNTLPAFLTEGSSFNQGSWEKEKEKWKKKKKNRNGIQKVMKKKKNQKTIL